MSNLVFRPIAEQVKSGSYLLYDGANILALTGTTKLANLKDNLGACAVELSTEERTALEGLAPRVVGDRYDSWGMAGING